MFTKYGNAFIDPTMAGHEHCSLILPSASSCSTKHSSGKFILLSSLWQLLLALETRVLSLQLMKYGFWIRSFLILVSQNYSHLQHIMFLIMTKSGIQEETVLISQNTTLPQPNSSTVIQIQQLANTNLETSSLVQL